MKLEVSGGNLILQLYQKVCQKKEMVQGKQAGSAVHGIHGAFTH